MATARGMRMLLASLASAAVLAGCASAPATPAEAWAVAAEPQPIAPSLAYAEARLASMSLDDKVATLMMIRVPGLDAAAMRAELRRTGASGLIFMGDNVPGSASQLRRTSESLHLDDGLPVLLAIDQEGGIVRRLPGDDAPAAAELRSLPPDAAERAFADRGALVAEAGVTINFGIVADVTRDEASFIRSRVLGGTAEQAAPRVAAAVEGEGDMVWSTLKHFPGHGAVAGDSHVSLPATGMSYERWLATQAPPFEAGIAAGAELVMFGHLRYTAVDSAPATLSPEWHRILRDELGFEGLIVTDDMAMLQNSGVARYSDGVDNAVAAIAAGNDLILFVGPIDVDAVARAAAAAIERGELDEATVDAAVLRVLTARRELSGREGPFIECAELCQALAE